MRRFKLVFRSSIRVPRLWLSASIWWFVLVCSASICCVVPLCRATVTVSSTAVPATTAVMTAILSLIASP